MLNFCVAQKILQDAILATNEVQHKQLETCKNNTLSLDFIYKNKKQKRTQRTNHHSLCNI